MAGNDQKTLAGMEKTAEQKKAEVQLLKNAMGAALGLPGRSIDIMAILKDASPEDLQSLVSMCKSVTPRVRLLGTIATELM